ncbi:MAG TPA: hypothetical protein VK912_03005 [Longimicrobiales bacterium]|nr:hypothetical protein [Longimicrobiales bacterium]
MVRRIVLVAAIAVVAFSGTSAAQQADTDPLRVFVDCDFRCDMDFLRTEIGWVDYMRDRADAQVHILGTSQSTGGGGRQYTLEFIGLRGFAGRTDTLVYNTTADDTEEIARRGLAQTIKLGLVPFIAGSPLGQRLAITLPAQPAAGAAPELPQRDPWNFWTFRVNFNGNVEGESSREAYRLSSGFSANRTTEAWKLNLSINGSYSEQSFTFPLESGDTTITSFNRNYSASSLVVKSFGDHMSVGARTNASTSTFGNTSLSLTFTPAIEFNLFPYSESTRRQLTALYAAGGRALEYRDTTIYGQIEEVRPLHSLTVGYSTRQPWGSVNMSVDGSQFLHDRSKYSITVFGGLSDIRLFKGFSFNVFGNYSLVRNQIALARGSLTQEEVLLRQRELATDYRFFISGGISYRFGSIFNNVVNPRFTGSEGVVFFF